MAAEALISKPLIYKYFPRLPDLFKAPVEREYRYLRGRGLGVLPKNVPHEDVIHRSNLRSMEYLYERGPIIRLLASDRSITGLAKRQDRDERGVIIDYFTKTLPGCLWLPARGRARLLDHDGQRANLVGSGAAQQRHCRTPRREIWSDFVIGGNNALQMKYGKARRAEENLTLDSLRA